MYRWYCPKCDWVSKKPPVLSEKELNEIEKPSCVKCYTSKKETVKLELIKIQ